MPSELAAALLKVHAALKPLTKKTDGPRGKYADLATVEEAVLPLLVDAGLAWTCKPMLRKDGQFVLRYKLVHAASGEREKGDWPLHGSANSQQMGSEVTYARRYCLGAVTGAVAKGEDDDGAAASQGRTQSRPRAAQKPTAPVTRTPTTGADHERLRHGTVVRTPDDRPAQRGPVPAEQDAWKDRPAGKLANGNGGKVGLLQAHFKRLEVHDREERLGLTAKLAGLPAGEVIGSTNDLSADEVDRVFGQLEKCRNHEALMALVTHGERPGGGDD